LTARFLKARAPVLVLGRDRTGEALLEKNGFQFVDQNGRKSRVTGASSARRSKPAAAGIAFFCVKSGALASAIKSAKPWIGPDTAVVSLQNGIGHEKTLLSAFGKKRLVFASAWFGADRPGPFIVHHNGGNGIDLARGTTNLASANLAANALKRAGWTIKIVASYEKMHWLKLCFNAATNPLGAVCAASNGQLAEDPALRQLMLRAFDEAASVSVRLGALPTSKVASARSQLLQACRAMPHQRNSMLQDIAAGRKTEAADIVGPIIRSGRRLNVRTPVLSFLDRMIATLEAA
jgi:2-dehydropantoate 2-reductase